MNYKLSILALLLTGISLSSHAQSYRNKKDTTNYDRFLFDKFNPDGLIEFARVIEFPGTSSHEIYVQTKKWLAKRITSSKDAIQLDDERNGILSLATGVEGGSNYKLTIDFKDNKARIKANNIHDVSYSTRVGQFSTYDQSGAKRYTIERENDRLRKQLKDGFVLRKWEMTWKAEVTQHFNDLFDDYEKYVKTHPDDF